MFDVLSNWISEKDKLGMFKDLVGNVCEDPRIVVCYPNWSACVSDIIIWVNRNDVRDLEIGLAKAAHIVRHSGAVYRISDKAGTAYVMFTADKALLGTAMKENFEQNV